MSSQIEQKSVSRESNTKLNQNHNAVVQDYGSINHGNSVEEVVPGKDHEICYHGSNDNSIHTPSPLPPTSYSVLQARIVSSLIIILYSTSNGTTSLISQYLLERWSAECGHNNSHAMTSVCHRNESDASVKKEDEIQSKVSLEVMYFSYATSGPAILSCVVFGALVDLIGRRPAIISSLLGSTLKVLVVVLIIKFDLHTNFFYLAFALDGIGGSFVVNLLAVFSLTADLNVHKGSRILWISILTCLGSTTMAVTNIGTGYLMEYISYFSASVALLAPLGLSLFCAFFLLPETMPASMKQQKPLKKLWKYMMRIFYLYLVDGSKRTRWALFIALMIFFTSVLNYINLGTTDTLFQRHQPLCWNPTEIGFYSGFKNGGQFILGVIYLKIHQAIGCARDEVMAMFGMLFMAASFVMEAFVTKTWHMYMVPIIAVPSANIAPISRGVMSYLAGPKKQGVLFSSIAVIEALCQMTSATTYNKVYAATVDVMPGAVYFVMAGMSVITFLLFIPFFYCYEGPNAQKSYEKLIQTDEECLPSSQEEPT